jgi:hypothetical protein
MSLFSKKPAFVVAALAAAGISAEQVDAAYAAGNTQFLVGESDTRAQMAADILDTARLLEISDAAVKGAADRENALTAALSALGIDPVALFAAGADPAAIAAATLKTAAAHEAAETLSRHGIKPLAGASAPAGGANTMTASEFAGLDHSAKNAFMRVGGKISDNN